MADALTFCRQKPVYCVIALLLSQLMYSAMSGMSKIVRLLGIRWNLVQYLKNLFLGRYVQHMTVSLALFYKL